VLCAADGELRGADGLLVLREAPGFAAEMRVFNADGSEAEMCGNGVRCAARYLFDRGASDRFGLFTKAGPIGVEVVEREPFSARIDMGPVTFPHGPGERSIGPGELTLGPGSAVYFHEVSVGNPHAVIFVEDVAAIDLADLAARFAASGQFPAGVNVHVAQRVDAQTLRVRHFERGVGLTQACGTGAVACAAIAVELGVVQSPVALQVPGGTLRVDWAPGGNALLTGPAETLFERTLAF
jgi:diaminopimelate epimerase